MLTLAEFYLMSGEEVSTSTLEKNFAQTQIYVGEEAVRNYTRRYIDPMVWEDRFQRPNKVYLHEGPILEIVTVAIDGVILPAEAYYYHAATSRLYARIDDAPWNWPWGWADWLYDDLTPDEIPQYYANWCGVGSLVVVYKAGYSPVPMVIKQVVSDYVYERVLAQRAIANSGGSSPIPAGTVSSVSIEGVGTLKYSDSSSTTAGGSRRAALSGEPVIGAAGPLLDAYMDVAVAVPGIAGLISHKKVFLAPPAAAASSATYDDAPDSYILYSDNPDDLVLFQDPGNPSVMIAQTSNPVTRDIWNGVYWPATIFPYPRLVGVP